VSGNTATDLTRVGGWIGLADAVAALWLASGLILNEMHGRDVLPLRPYVPR
jgi:succinate-acetate transporter protein